MSALYAAGFGRQHTWPLAGMSVTKPYKFIGFAAMDVTSREARDVWQALGRYDIYIYIHLFIYIDFSGGLWDGGSPRAEGVWGEGAPDKVGGLGGGSPPGGSDKI